jgi:hypothetical protein
VSWQSLCKVRPSIADPNYFDTGPDPNFHFETDPTIWYEPGYGSQRFQGGNLPKTVPVLFINFKLIFLVSRSARRGVKQQANVVTFFVLVSFVMLI